MKKIILILLLISFIFLINSCLINNYQERVSEVRLENMPLRDKIAQMLIIEGKLENLEKVSDLNIGGIFLFPLENENQYINTIETFQKKSKYDLFVVTDLEGCVNMLENIQVFKYFSEVENEAEAYNLGIDMGILLKRLGFNINFAPVLDLEDTIWHCRSFTGTNEQIIAKGISFIQGLKSTGIITTAKHFPGRTLNVADTHIRPTSSIIKPEDLSPFYRAIAADVDIIMINHLIVSGELDSQGIPSSVSSNIINDIKKQNFDGLVITDDLKMKGISSLFPERKDVYIEAINAGNSLLLHVYEEDPEGVIDYIEKALIKGIIDPKLIDSAVTTILEKKGIQVI